MKFSDFVPQALLDEVTTRRFLTVLDGVADFKREVLEEFRRSFNPITISKVSYLRKFIEELGNIALAPGMPRQVLENLVLNAYAIFALKGTAQGIKLFLEIVSLGNVLLDTSRIIRKGNFIVPDDIYRAGKLMLSNEVSQPVTDENYSAYLSEISAQDNGFFFIFDGSSFDSGVSYLGISIETPFAPVYEFREYLKLIVPRMMPLSSDIAQISIYLYHQIPMGTPWAILNIPS